MRVPHNRWFQPPRKQVWALAKLLGDLFFSGAWGKGAQGLAQPDPVAMALSKCPKVGS